MLICYSAHLSIDVHCSTHLKQKNDFLFHSLIKIIQTYIILLFLLIQDLPYSCPLKTLSFFFIISSSSLISHQAPRPSDLSHQPSSLIKLSSPLNNSNRWLNNKKIIKNKYWNIFWLYCDMICIPWFKNFFPILFKVVE